MLQGASKTEGDEEQTENQALGKTKNPNPAITNQPNPS
jgi:hypothetical protein